jgi:hypothetical protein
MPALNPPPATNNLLGLAMDVAATGRGDVPFTDTGEPTFVNSPAGAVTKTATFPLNGAGNQPLVTRGGYALVVKAVNAATVVGPTTIFASDGNVAHDEVIDIIPTFAAGQGGCIAKPFNSSLAAGIDAGTITNVVSLKAVTTVTAGTGATIAFAATGTS